MPRPLSCSAATAFYSTCKQAAQQSAPENYNLAEGEWQGRADGGWQHDRYWDWHHQQTQDNWWHAQQAGHDQWSQDDWHQYGRGGSAAAEGGAMDTTTAAVPGWMRDDTAHANAHGERAWRRPRKNGEDAGGTQGRVTEEAVLAHAADAKLHEETARAQAGLQGDPKGSGGVDGAMATAPEALHARREAIIQQAKFDGVECNLAEIAQLDHAELESWAKEFLL